MWNVLHHYKILITPFIVKDHFSLCLTDVSYFCCLQLLAFLQGLFTFYHEGYELAHEFEPYKQQLQFNLQNVSPRTSVWMAATFGHGMLFYLKEPESIALNHNCFCVPSFCHHDLGAHSLKNQILSLTLNVSTIAVIIYTPTLTLDAKPLSRQWGHLSCSSRENETALIWPLCLDKEDFLEPKVMLSFFLLWIVIQ